MEAPTGGGIELAVVRRFVDVAVDALAAAREEIDALNVYPVPDGDTGTNMYLTMSAARDAIHQAAADDADLLTALAAFRRGALLGARGNSGVILSQLLGALVARIGRAQKGERNATLMAEAMAEATEAAYAAVGTPVEGTILTVARAASDAAVRRAEDAGTRARDVFAAAAEAAREALSHTPEQLEELRAAGVVDAGGRGLSVVLDAAETVLTGRRPVSAPQPIGSHTIPVPVGPPGHAGLREGGPAYEVMYLLDADDDAVPALREALGPLGDSLVVVGGERLWNVHVHVDDVGAAIEAGIAAGRPHRVRVTHFAEQVARQREQADRRAQDRSGRRIVAVSAGPGLARLFGDAGAIVIEGGPGNRPSTGAILEAVTESGAAEIVILPNDHDSVRAARIAARTAEEDLDVRVAVIPTEAQVQGLAALAVHEPARGFDADVLEMTATARHTRHGAVTIAARRAITMAGPCEPGDVLGVIEGDFALVGHDLTDVATEILERMLGGGGELVTLVSGTGANGLAQRCEEYVADRHAHVDVVVYDGGQDRYPLLMSVE
ncbi:MAG TPA: DAK2 domain-containing protein [Nocardioides sp.]|uniref:DAK2 domain-containing protein n=1 Tax=Nocardioides sp. TaxID=35761 RepID=UPI002F4072AB